ncbi:ATP-binding protein [Nonomuraea sp. NPDC048916]|uniref:ATP-binding protein n=1 Tax=Nonomuraea sp. NPDC048916 TaxID=3154232 RepID=UPI0033D81CBA
MSGQFLGELVLPGVVHSVPVARRCVGEMLTAAGHRDVEAARLVVTELVTNAVIHTASGRPGGVITVEINTIDGGMARIEVIDEGASAVPRPRVPDQEHQNGRGLWLVERSSLRWGMRRAALEWCVIWAEVSTAQEVPFDTGKEDGTECSGPLVRIRGELAGSGAAGFHAKDPAAKRWRPMAEQRPASWRRWPR